MRLDLHHGRVVSGGLSRQDVLVRGAALGLAGLGVSAGGALGATQTQAGGGQAPERQRAPHANYRRSVFESADRAVLTVGSRRIPVRIDDVQAIPSSEGARVRSRLWENAFAVTFSAAPDTSVPQGTHSITIGRRTFDLFLAPVLSRGSRPAFEAIVHRAFGG